MCDIFTKLQEVIKGLPNAQVLGKRHDSLQSW